MNSSVSDDKSNTQRYPIDVAQQCNYFTHKSYDILSGHIIFFLSVDKISNMNIEVRWIRLFWATRNAIKCISWITIIFLNYLKYCHDERLFLCKHWVNVLFAHSICNQFHCGDVGCVFDFIVFCILVYLWLDCVGAAMVW